MQPKEQHPLEKIFENLSIPVTVYRGRVVKRLVGGWEVAGVKAANCSQVDEIIDTLDKGGLFPDTGYIGVDDKFKGKQEQWRKQRFGD